MSELLWSDDKIAENIKARESTVRSPHGAGLVAVGTAFNLMQMMRDDYESHQPPAEFPTMTQAAWDALDDLLSSAVAAYAPEAKVLREWMDGAQPPAGAGEAT